MDKLAILNQRGKMLFGLLVILFLLWDLSLWQFSDTLLRSKKSRRSTTGFSTQIFDNCYTKLKLRRRGGQLEG
ncbi:hypothetical protein B5D77_13635 [Microcystis sp. MC19]|nr:hypothetical protein B5D77_13635 [Microcystis sp. MC19]